VAGLPEVIPVTDLRQDAKAIVSRIQASGRPFIITQRGRAAAVMLSVAAYERLEHDLELAKLLLQGEKEIAEGKFYTLDEVMAEADALLADTND
jgi:prevent-host-death family protein